MLWASLPREKRKQLLLDMMKESSGSFRFCGVRVCTRAFQKLSGISAGLIQDIRSRIAKGAVNIWSSRSISWLEVKNQSKAARYLDCRAWIEAYAETHGEKSPMSLRVYLPAGRKFFYHSQYEYERRLGFNNQNKFQQSCRTPCKSRKFNDHVGRLATHHDDVYVFAMPVPRSMQDLAHLDGKPADLSTFRRA